MSPPALRARLLGTVDLQLNNQPLPPLDSARAESLLAYLLLHRDAPQPRQRLAFLLWPGCSRAATTNGWPRTGSGSPGCTPTRWSGSPASTSSTGGGPKPSAAPSA